MIGVGESDSDSRAIEAVEKAISNPLLDVEVSGATGALIGVLYWWLRGDYIRALQEE